MNVGTGTVPVWRFGDALETLRTAVARGAVLAIPTESSYGLGVDPRNPDAVKAVYRIKHRESRKPLLVVAANVGQLEALGVDLAAPAVQRLLALWPAPLTAVVPLAASLPASAEERTLAVRIPDDDRLRRLLTEVGPLTATSANLAGDEPLLSPEDLPALLRGFDAVIVDGGRLAGGLPSTLVELGLAGPRVLRQGAFPVARFSAVMQDLMTNSSLNSTTPVEDVAENPW